MERNDPPRSERGSLSLGVVLAAAVGTALAGLIAYQSFTIVPAGHVGVAELGGKVSEKTLPPGFKVVVPFTRVTMIPVESREVPVEGETTSADGQSIGLSGSFRYRIDPARAIDIYRAGGRGFQKSIVAPSFRIAVREVTAAHSAGALDAASPEAIAASIADRAKRLAREQGIIVEQFLLNRIDLPESAGTPAGSTAKSRRIKRFPPIPVVPGAPYQPIAPPRPIVPAEPPGRPGRPPVIVPPQHPGAGDRPPRDRRPDNRRPERPPQKPPQQGGQQKPPQHGGGQQKPPPQKPPQQRPQQQRPPQQNPQQQQPPPQNPPPR